MCAEVVNSFMLNLSVCYFQQKKERALKRQKREGMLLNDSQNYCRVESTRSCRNRRPVSYTFGMT